MFFSQLFDMVNLGIIILDSELNVQKWNRWLEMHTRIPAEEIVGAPLFDYFPNLNKNWFIKNCKSVFSFGNFSFFSQKLHNYIIPISPVHHFDPEFKYMQQNCTLGPLYNKDKEIEYIYMIIQDATEVAAYEAKLLDINTRDTLTEIYNRRYFEAKLKHEIERHKRYKRPLSLIVIDIDNFKQVNEKCGSQAGDNVLIQLASVFINRLRIVDTVARYNGEEFSLILPETTPQSALNVAEQLRELVKKSSFSYDDESINITISLGIVDATGDEITVDNILEKIKMVIDTIQEQDPDSILITQH
jgi:diguanylate cyclase (GGDEF)-like protein